MRLAKFESKALEGNKLIVLWMISLKGGYIDFSYLTELKKNIYIYIPEMYMKKQYKSWITKNNKIKIFLMVFP